MEESTFSSIFKHTSGKVGLLEFIDIKLKVEYIYHLHFVPDGSMSSGKWKRKGGRI